MKGQFGKIIKTGKKFVSCIVVFAVAFYMLMAAAADKPAGIGYVWALSPGSYLVNVSPSYRDPETGNIEDPGNNEAIGQGMTEKLCGPAGLLEIADDGSMYLTVRYYLSQFVNDISFEERTGSSGFVIRPFTQMKSVAPVEGATDIDDKYGYTDYRIQIRDMGSVFRGKAYIQPMGRNVVYFFTFSSPVEGSGDFISSINAPSGGAANQNQETVPGSPGTDRGSVQGYHGGYTQKSSQGNSYTESYGDLGSGENSSGSGYMGSSGYNPASKSADAGTRQTVSGSGQVYSQGDFKQGEVNGSGSAQALVTGIPQKPSDLAARSKNSLNQGYIQGDKKETMQNPSYRLDTDYDLEAVPIDKARKLTRPMLDNAVGITGMDTDKYKKTGSLRRSEAEDDYINTARLQPERDKKKETDHITADGNIQKRGISASQKVMFILLAVSALLAATFILAQFRKGGYKEGRTYGKD